MKRIERIKAENFGTQMTRIEQINTENFVEIAKIFGGVIIENSNHALKNPRPPPQSALSVLYNMIFSNPFSKFFQFLSKKVNFYLLSLLVNA